MGYCGFYHASSIKALEVENSNSHWEQLKSSSLKSASFHASSIEALGVENSKSHKGQPKGSSLLWVLSTIKANLKSHWEQPKFSSLVWVLSCFINQSP